MPEQRIFRDDGRLTESFCDEMLVHCPDCSARCKIMVKSGQVNAFMSPRVVACYECGLQKEWHGKSLTKYTDGRDWYFGFQLWLQTPCCGNLLWVFNERHLAYLDDYVHADVRQQRSNVNQSMISALPRWIKDAKNGKDVRKGFERLRAKLEQQR